MAGFQNGQWFWPNFIQISPTVIPTSPAGSTGFTEFPERLTHSYYVDLHPNSTWRIGKAMKSSPLLGPFCVQNSGDFLCSKYKEVVCFYVSNLRQLSATEKSTVNQCRADYCLKFEI